MPKRRRTRTQRRDPHESPVARPGIEKSARRARQVCRARFDFRNTCPMHSVALYASVSWGGLGMPARHESIEKHRSPAFSALIAPSQPHPDTHEPPRRQRDIL